MIYKSLFIVLAFMTVCFGKLENRFREHESPEVTEEKVKIQMYFETFYNSDTAMFISSLYPLIATIGDRVDLYTYPFGDAYFMDANQTKVTCQGGYEACYGNKILACAIDQLNDTLKYVTYVKCVLWRSSDDAAAEYCGRAQGVDYESILKCAKGSRGQELLIYYGKETYKVRPGQFFTPYVIINGKEIGIRSKKTLSKAVCEAFKNPPQACKDIY